MIKFKKIPENVLEKLPLLIQNLKTDKSITAVYLFGSAATGKMKPLSDLDIAVLLDKNIERNKYLDEYLRISGTTVHILKTDEVDLVILNEAPMRIAHTILKTGELLFTNNPVQLSEFIAINFKLYPDFMYYKHQYDSEFHKQIGLLQ